ncbi:MAG TPA: serine/threonine-protein kinase [Gemmatimonadaceae bacterium]|nr:serine/threonine-protein kinase [Gemmatimonadaceae bacterium]
MSDGAREGSAERDRRAHEASAAAPSSPTIGVPALTPDAEHGRAVIADRYRLLHELGRGAAAIVWLAHDLVAGRDVAVKILRDEIANTVASTRFLEEIRILTEFAHPNLLPILGSGEWDGLLYYVSPFIEGGSLRGRLDRERQLPIDDALRIVHDVAGALAYAHIHDVIHRDVKPENILIDGEHALVADFGIARALTRAAGERITSTGISVGTPAYMSPEQGAGNRELDQRTDIYSLACVLYEMLAGVAPFVGPTPESVIAQRFLHAPHPLRSYRMIVSAEVERAVACAMAIAPADRPQTMQAFAQALRATPTVTVTSAAPAVAAPSRRTTPRLLGGALAVATLAVAATMFMSRSAATDGRLGAGLDSTRYLVAYVNVTGVRMSPADARARMTDALRRWRDLRVVSLADGDDDGKLAQSASGAAKLAARAGAGRVVVARLAAAGDSVELTASVRDAASAALREFVTRAPRGDSSKLARLFVVAGAALTGTADVRDGGDEWLADAMGTQSAGAWRAYGRGRSALAKWNLDSALREMGDAVGRDPEFAQAQLWLAQVSAWARPQHPEEWKPLADRAKALRMHLSPRDSLLADAVALLAAEEYPKACSAYHRVASLEPASDVGWYGIGQCQAMDPVVLPDARSPSGWAFRSSYYSAAHAYANALTRTRGAPSFAYDRLRWVLFLESFRLRAGHGPAPDTTTFLAHPALTSDTLAFVPYPAALVYAADPRTLPATLSLALSRDADLLAAHFKEWVRRAPTSADALAALAFAQEVRGDYETREGAGLAALANLRAAVAASASDTQRLALSAGIVRVLIKDERFADAHRVADSLLDANPQPSSTNAAYLAGLAALVGRLGRAEQLLSLVSTGPGQSVVPLMPHQVAVASAALLADAALGVCSPRIDSLVGDVDESVDRYVAPENREVVRTGALGRSLSFAFPCLSPSAIERIGPNAGRIAAMQRAFTRGEARRVRAHFDTLARMRRVDRAGDISLDYTLQEAWLLLGMGDTLQAQRHLCTPLAALPTLGTKVLRDVPQAAAIGRSLLLCAQMSARRGDRASASRWARNVALLWSTADPLVRSQLADLGALAHAQ